MNKTDTTDRRLSYPQYKLTWMLFHLIGIPEHFIEIIQSVYSWHKLVILQPLLFNKLFLKK